MTPVLPSFWIIFLVGYFFGPVSEWVIFRRLWALPTRGLFPLLRKRLSNELLLGYSGELYFYSWARRNASLVAAPFGAVKDVAMLSAAIGNFSTLILIGACWPSLRNLQLGVSGRLMITSAAIVMTVSLATLLFRRILFTLPPRDLVFISAVHFVRTLVGLVTTATLWVLVLPVIPISLWLILVTMRMLVSRLPLVPNKDIVFAGIAAFWVGSHSDVAALLYLITGFTLTAHLVVAAALSLSN